MDAVFLADGLLSEGTLPLVGDAFRLDGAEGRHAAVVRRIGPGESVVVSDGLGRAIRGEVLAADKTGLDLRVTEQLAEPERPLRLVAVQALAKGERSDLAIEMLTEIGVDEIVPWQAQRSIVRWQGDRGAKSLAKWRATVREAAKQSRRLRVPDVSEPVTSKQLTARLAQADLALVLHEEASAHLAAVTLPASGELVIVIGPEGGVAPDEIAAFEAAGALPVLISQHVLRTSTAGVVALAQLDALTQRAALAPSDARSSDAGDRR